ncbi:MAG: GNAT family N-acetyltransferase [Phycisphaerae bacterium]|nr:GNAT family N-acetyltransferase [Phycisphaerae bacterium]
MPTIRISLDPRDHDLDAIHAILAGTYWSPAIRRDVVEAALANSITAVAIDDEARRTVGLARVVTDRATFAWLCDVAVVEDCRGLGIARQLLDALHGHPDLGTLRRWCLATRDAHGLYEKFGYAPVKPGRWMERVAPNSVWQDSALQARGT